MFWSHPVLAIETSCDETSAAVVVGREVRSNIVASQIEMHKKWGGVVPEAAARAHVESILPVILEALNDTVPAGIAVTNRPGLLGALSVGVSAAKALARAWDVPLIGIHHLEGHIFSPFAEPDVPKFPCLTLVVSGGHTEIVYCRDVGQYQLVGETLDDAAGEAFDKGARLIGLGYPGGRAIEEAALLGDPTRYPLPRAVPKDQYHFSFSGLKTAMLRLVEREGKGINVADAAASLQAAIVDALVSKTLILIDECQALNLSLVGGVAANRRLRERLSVECVKRGVSFFCPRYELCTDNAAMIGLAGSFRLFRGERDGFELDVFPNSSLPGLEMVP